MMFEILNRTIICNTPRFDVFCDRVVTPTNDIKDYYYLSKRNAVLVVPYWDNFVSLIYTNRYLINEISIETIGGRIEDGEDPLTAAKRELYEEISIQSNDFKYLTSINPLPSITTEKVYIFAAKITNIKQAALQTDEDIVSLEYFQFDEIPNLVLSNKFKSAIDAFAVLYFHNWIRDRNEKGI